MRIKYKTILLFVLAGLIPLVASSFFAITQAQQTLTDEIKARGTIFTTDSIHRINAFFDEASALSNSLAVLPPIREGLATLKSNGPESDWKFSYSEIDPIITQANNQFAVVDLVFLTDSSGKCVYVDRYRDLMEGSDMSGANYIHSALKNQPAWSDPFYFDALKTNAIVYSTPVVSKTNASDVLGTLDAMTVQNTLDQLVQSGIQDFGKTADTFAVKSDGTLLTNQRLGDYSNDAALKVKLATDVVGYLAGHVQSSDYNFSGQVEYKASTGAQVLAYVGVVKWGGQPAGLVVGVNKDEGFNTLYALQSIMYTVIGAAVAVGLGISLYVARVMANPTRKLLEAVRQVAQGDLTVTAQANSTDEIGMLAAGFNEMVASNAQLISSLKRSATALDSMSQQYAQSSSQVASTSEQLSAGAQQIAKGSADQANAAENTNKLMDEMNKKIKEVAEAAAKAETGAQKDTAMAGEGLAAAKEAQDRMNEINASSKRSADVVKGLVARSKEIGQTANVITGIADQTNLLALNAAIEAARAGEHGRGFAVVAEEVRKLAEESKKAADQIAKLNDQINAETAGAVKAIEENAVQSEAGVDVINSKVLTTLGRMSQTAQEAEMLVRNINESTHKQLEMAGQVGVAMASVAAASEEASATTEEFSASIEEINASVEENTAGVEELTAVVRQLTQLITKYKVDLQEEVSVAPDLTPSPTSLESLKFVQSTKMLAQPSTIASEQ